MPYDGLTAHAVVAELKDRLIGSKIHKIYQPVKEEIVLSFSDKGKSTLLLCADPTFPRVNLTQLDYENPINAPAFCMLLRKYLMGAIVKDVNQKDFDRIVILELENLSSSFELLNLSLYCEIMGKYSNIILVNQDTGLIIDAIRHVSHNISSVREVLAQVPYVFPPNEKLNPLSFENETAAEMLSLHKNKSVYSALMNSFMGISNQLAQSFLLSKAGVCAEELSSPALSDMPYEKMLELCELFRAFIIEAAQESSGFIYKTDEGAYKDFSCVYYEAYKELECASFEGISQACEEYYRAKAIASHSRERNSEIIKKLSLLAAKENNKLLARKKELENAQNADEFMVYGNLLLGAIGKIKKGEKSVSLLNYCIDPPAVVEIALKENLSASQNAQRYFKLYSKAKNAMKVLDELITSAEEALYYLTSQIMYLKNAADKDESDQIIADLIKRGFLKNKKKLMPKSSLTLKPRRYITNDGSEILVGRNDAQNDRLTFKTSNKDDIWLHVKDIHGSHVILKTSEGRYSSQALLCAARLAAFYSSARASGNTSVDYTYIRNVKKPNGAALGRVIYTDQKTIIVNDFATEIDGVKQVSEELKDNPSHKGKGGR